MAEGKVKLEDLSLEEGASGLFGESVDKRESGDEGAAKETKDPFPGDLCASEHKTDDHSYLHFMMWTVNGLRKKLKDERVVNMIGGHDVIFLLETRIKKDEDESAANQVIPAEFVARHYYSKDGEEYSQSQSLLYRKTLEGCIDIERKVQSGICSIWVTFKKEKFGMSSDVIVCSVYIPPDNTRVSYTVPEAQNYIVNELKNDTLVYSEKGKVFVCGCFNARQKGNYYKPRIKSDGAQVKGSDKGNPYGTSLEKYCKEASMTVVEENESMFKGVRGSTHTQEQSETRIDYLLAKEDNLEEVNSFHVEYLEGQKKHAILYFDLSIPNPDL